MEMEQTAETRFYGWQSDSPPKFEVGPPWPKLWSDLKNSNGIGKRAYELPLQIFTATPPGANVRARADAQ